MIKGRYRIEELIGVGGFAKVYKAFDTKLDMYVALKRFSVSELRAKFKGREEYAERYGGLGEIRRAVKLNHPNVLRYFDTFVYSIDQEGFGEEQYEVLVMEYLGDGDLADFAERYGIESEAFFEAICGVLKGLSYLHDHGILHRDLKAANVLFSGKEAKITDFGISKAYGREGDKLSSALLGTPEFYAPERIAPEEFGIEGKIGYNSDLWSFGVMLYRLCTGEYPFGSRSEMEDTESGRIMGKILNKQYVPPKLEGIQEPYRRLITSCLVRDASKRLQSAGEGLALLTGNKKKAADQPVETAFAKSDDEETILVQRGKGNLPSEMPGVQSPAAQGEGNRHHLLKYFRGIKNSRIALGLGVLAGVIFWLSKITNSSDAIMQNMVWVEGGRFTMGCQEGRDGDCDDNEYPAHEVELSGYWMGKYEVTQAEWRAVMGSDPPKLYNKGCDDCPVERVSWGDVQEFLARLNEKTGKTYRLPTEAEWEYAARGGKKSRGYLYAGSNNLDEVGWYGSNYQEGKSYGAKGTTHPVGQKKPNELGLYDMSGNVWEWCRDWYDGDYYEACEARGVVHNPRGSPMGSERVRRGGGWRDIARRCRASYRRYWPPGYRYHYLGFRLVRVP